MGDENNSDPAQFPSTARRSSFAGQTFADIFGTGRSNTQRTSNDSGNNSPPTAQYPGPISQAAAQAQRRRMSLTTLGLSGSPNSGSAFNRGVRRDSISSANSGSIDESAIEDDAAPRDPASATTPTTPFARRMSFGARALRDVRNSSGAGGGGGGTAGQNGTKSPPAPTASTATANAKAPNGSISSRDAKGRGRSTHVPHRHFHHHSLSLLRTYTMLTGNVNVGSTDFWNENMRTRAERTSIGGGGMPIPSAHNRAKSVAVMEPPIREMPAPKQEQRRPDHIQERMLRGDFMMD